MEYSIWAGMRQNPNPNPNSDPLYSSFYTTNYPQNHNSDAYSTQHCTSIDPHGAFAFSRPRPPDMEQPYVPPPVAEIVTHTQPYVPQQIPDAPAAAASYYPDPNASYAAAFAQLIGASYAAAGVTMPNPTTKPYRSYPKKKDPHKLKFVQSAWCEVCSINCTSKDILDQHKLGKKHKKNLENLKGTITNIAAPAPSILAPLRAITAASSVSTPSIEKPIIGQMENPARVSDSHITWKKAASNEDLETKKRKIIEGGAAAEAVRSCVFCNVVCNSETVFRYHLAGQKHAYMVSKHLSLAAVAYATWK